MQFGAHIEKPIAKDWNEELMNMHMVQEYLHNKREKEKEQDISASTEELDQAM